MNTNKHRTPSESNSGDSVGQTSKSAGPKIPEFDGKESFDDAVTEHLNQEGSGQAAEETPGGEAGDKENNQPALEEQDEDGNPAKTDNE